MKNIFCSLTIMLATLTLSGCGLKGPLYFPPDDAKPQQAAPAPTPQPAVTPKPVQTTTPDRNNRGIGDGPTQVVY